MVSRFNSFLTNRIYSCSSLSIGCFTEVRTYNGVESKDCIFPFKFKGKTYASCTKDHTTNNKVWCATKVDSIGTVIDGKWGDCDSSCSEADSNEYCQQSEFFYENGRCIKRSVVEPELQLQINLYKIDDNYGQDNNATTKCFEPISAKKCICNLTKINGQFGEACEQSPLGQ